MSTKVCPTCEGLCCREGSGMHSMHRVRVYTKHVCPDCDAGLVWATHTKSASEPVWTAEDERAAVVAYLHHRANLWLNAEKIQRTEASMGVWLVCQAIERGEHRKEKA